MHFEEPDKDLAGRLGDLLPAGSSFREEAVWTGIGERLGRRRRIVLWRRLAVAAVLLLLLGAGWIFRDATLPAMPETRNTGTAKTDTPKASNSGTVAQTGRHRPGTTPIPLTPVHPKIKRSLPQPQVPALAVRSTPDTAAAQNTVALQPKPGPEVGTPASTAIAATTTAPARRSFRIGHMNEEAVSQPVALEQPLEEAPNYSLLRHRAAAGPSAESAEPAPPRPRTLMSLFKSHQ